VSRHRTTIALLFSLASGPNSKERRDAVTDCLFARGPVLRAEQPSAITKAETCRGDVIRIASAYCSGLKAPLSFHDKQTSKVH